MKIKHYDIDREAFENGAIDFSEQEPVNVSDLDRAENRDTVLNLASDINTHNTQRVKIAKTLNSKTIKDYRILTTN